MTFTIFLMLFTTGSIASALCTEAFKKAFDESNIKYTNNGLALLSAFTIGLCCTAGAYVLLEIPFDLIGIICIAFMVLAIWVGAMVGYDKVTQLLEQIQRLEP